jgi:adenylate kinase family enzyme
MKALIHILGPGSSGKSTLSRNLLEDRSVVEVSTAVQALDQHSGVTKVEMVKYTLSRGGMALAGNLKNGSDSVKSTEETHFE